MSQNIICKELQTPKIQFKACGGSAICLSSLVYISCVFVCNVYFSEFVTLSTNTFDVMCVGIIVSKFDIRVLSQWFPSEEMDILKGKVAWSGGYYVISPPSSVTLEMSRIGQFRVSALTLEMAATCTSVKKQKDADPQWRGGRSWETFVAVY